MSNCQLTDEMKLNLCSKLREIQQRVDTIVSSITDQENCLLCEISGIKDLAFELEVIASFYHFQSTLLPDLKGMDEISKALATLSEKRHGALIALELKDNLDPVVIRCNTTGTSIDANVSSSLVQCIFYPGNPLHDGSIIVRDGKILSAGCVFPLSAQKLSREGRKLGTRHRAALGLSEKADALVIVVSEETGQVSFAMNGELHPIEVKLCENLQ